MEIDSDKIKALVDGNHAYTTRDVAEILNVSKSSVENHLKALGYASKLDVWTPRQLEQVHLLKRIITRDSLLKPEENDPFLKRVITGDEKWIVCGDIERKESWSKRDEPAQSTLKAEKIIKGRLRCQFRRIGKGSCFLNCFRGMKRLIRACTVDN